MGTRNPLVAGSGLAFHERGIHTLKGHPANGRGYSLDERRPAPVDRTPPWQCLTKVLGFADLQPWLRECRRHTVKVR